jgi:hypothetical protein
VTSKAHLKALELALKKARKNQYAKTKLNRFPNGQTALTFLFWRKDLIRFYGKIKEKGLAPCIR